MDIFSSGNWATASNKADTEDKGSVVSKKSLHFAVCGDSAT